jgi:O-antigen ligase
VLVEAVENPDYEALNRASGRRLPIWSTALRMGADNWLNGVGARGLRYAYDDYAASGDEWAQPLADGRPGTRASHAHQLLLDLFSESGVFGLLGYLAIVAVLLRLWHDGSAAARSRALPFGLALCGMLFPINTHPAWYSSWSSSLLWLFIGLYLLALCDEPAPAEQSP